MFLRETKKKLFASIFTHESNILLPLQKMRRECALRMAPGKFDRITHSVNHYLLITMMWVFVWMATNCFPITIHQL